MFKIRAKKRYGLRIVSFEQLEDRPWVYAVTVRLHGRLGNVGDVLLRLNWRGMSSNRVRVAIGFEGGKIEDDEGAIPTPMPEKPPTKAVHTENIASLPWTGDSVRFMEQATFGPNSTQELRVRRIGISTWLNEQMEEKRDAIGAVALFDFSISEFASSDNYASVNNLHGKLSARQLYDVSAAKLVFPRSSLRRRPAIASPCFVGFEPDLGCFGTRNRSAFADVAVYTDFRPQCFWQLSRFDARNDAQSGDGKLSRYGNLDARRIRMKITPARFCSFFRIGLYMLNQDGTVQSRSDKAIRFRLMTKTMSTVLQKFLPVGRFAITAVRIRSPESLIIVIDLIV